MKAWEYRGIPLEERLLMQISVNATTGCHIWTGAKNTDGYGSVKDGGKRYPVHRLMYVRKYGDIGNKQVLHKCDTPACCNVDHLFLGTHAENMADKAAKGRSHNVPSGYSHKRPMAKINEEQARQIKDLLARGYRQCDIAADFKLSRQLINDIAKNKTWGHLK